MKGTDVCFLSRYFSSYVFSSFSYNCFVFRSDCSVSFCFFVKSFFISELILSSLILTLIKKSTWDVIKMRSLAFNSSSCSISVLVSTCGMWLNTGAGALSCSYWESKRKWDTEKKLTSPLKPIKLPCSLRKPSLSAGKSNECFWGTEHAAVWHWSKITKTCTCWRLVTSGSFTN